MDIESDTTSWDRPVDKESKPIFVSCLWQYNYMQFSQVPLPVRATCTYSLIEKFLLPSLNERAVLYFLLSGMTKEAAEEAYIKKVEELKKA